MARASRQPELARAIAKAFLAAGFSSADLLSGQITLTDLPWQCPPLRCEETLNGFPLSDYLDYPIGANARELYRFWRTGLPKLYESPSAVVDGMGWRNTSRVARSSSIGERNMRFCVPEDFPGFNAYQGHVFSLEVAHTFVNSCAVLGDLVTDESNYWVATEYGDVGVRDGVPIDSAQWTEDASYMLDVLLESGRGLPTTTCRYDLISKVRSVLNENADQFEEFTGLDWGLQALAKLSQDRLCGPLYDAIQNMLPDSFEAKRRINILDEALAMMDEWVANDRVKISALYETLVPTVYTVGAFHREIHNMAKPVPVIMLNAALKKIRTNLANKRKEILETLGPRDQQLLAREE